MSGRRVVVTLLSGAVVVSTWARTVRAESFVTCVPANIVEVFAGTADCPGAQYVVLQSLEQKGFGIAPIFSVDHCGAVLQTFGSGSIDWPSAQAGTRFLVARSEAEALFGIEADVEAHAYLPHPSGRLKYECWPASELIYGTSYAGSTAPGLELGKALAWTGTEWVLKDPAPVNSKGAVGVLGACPTEGGIAGSGGVSGSAGGAATGGYYPCGGSGGGGGTISGGSGGTTGGTGGSFNGGTAGTPDASVDSGGAGIVDAGDGAPSTFTDSGCDCRTHGTRRSSQLGLGVVLLLLSAWRRRAR